jgi:hypothetical protein
MSIYTDKGNLQSGDVYQKSSSMDALSSFWMVPYPCLQFGCIASCMFIHMYQLHNDVSFYMHATTANISELK